MEEKDKALGTGAPEVHAYLNMLQGVVNRMAGNSALCKTLCITLVAAIAAVAASAETPGAVWVALIPLIVFGVLDVLYLSLEKGFRNSYDRVVEKVHEGTLLRADLFKIEPEKGYSEFGKLLETLRSWSVWLAYGPLIVLLFFTWLII